MLWWLLKDHIAMLTISLFLKLKMALFSNQARAGRSAPGFLKLILCRLSVCVRVCVRAKGY